MPEANVKVTIENSDITYEAPPIESSMNICCFVNSPSGVYDLVKRASKSDFIKYNLLTNEILASDHDTVKHAGYLLSHIGAYVKRVGACPLKQGVSSLGEYLLFTEDYDLINEFFQVEIKKWSDELEYYYIAFGQDCYYTGNIDNMDEKTKARYNNMVKVADEKSIDLLVEYFYQYAKEDITVLASDETSITTRELLTFSPNLTVTINDNLGVYNRLCNTPGQTLEMGDFLQIRGTTYYFQGNGAFIPNRYTNPVAIYNSKDFNAFDSGLFLIRSMARVQDEATVYNPMPEIRGDGGLRLKYKNVEGIFEISEGCKNKIRLFDNNKTLGIFDNDDEVKDATIKCKFKREPMQKPAPVETTVASTPKADNGNVTISSNNVIKPEPFTTYKIQANFTNTWDWKTNIDAQINGTGKIATANILDFKTGQTFKLTIGTVTVDAGATAALTIKFNETQIHTENITATKNNHSVNTLNITEDGVLSIEITNASMATVKVEKTEAPTNKVRQATLKLDRNVLKTVDIDFSAGNTLNRYVIDNIELDNEGILSLELEKATATSTSIKKVYQEELSADQANGVDVEVNFIIGEPTETPGANTTEIQLFDSKASPLKILDQIIERLDADEDEELDDLGLENFAYSSSGTFEIYFLKKEKINKGTGKGNDIKSLVVKEDINEITYQYEFVSDAYIQNNQTSKDFYLKIGDVAYYVGQKPKIQAKKELLSKEAITFEVFMDKLQEKMALYHTDFGVYQNSLSFLSDVDVEAFGLDFNKKTIRQATSARFAAIQKFAVKDSDRVGKFFFAYSPVERDDDAQVWNLTLGYKGDSNTYDISFDPTVVDGFGRSLYYDSVQDQYIHIKMLEGTKMLERLDTFKWGNEITPREPTVSDYLTAINSLEEIEDIQLDFLWDTGYANPNITRALDSMARKLKAFNIVSLPTEYNGDKTGIRQVTQYLENLNLNSSSSRILWAKTLSGDVGNFGTYINGSALALTNYINNFNGGNTEFCPQFGTNYATINGNHKIVIDVTDRNNLLDKYRVCTIKGGNGLYAYHVNSHYTTQRVKSSYLYEQNVRIANTIAHGCERICYTKIGLPNNFFTRDTTKSQISNFINNRCVNGQVFALEDYRIICDRSNNSEAQEKRGEMNIEVYVKYVGAVEFVNVYLKTIPVSGENTSE